MQRIQNRHGEGRGAHENELEAQRFCAFTNFFTIRSRFNRER